ncbi:MAG: type III pantothenate kinase [Lachnospiraceae bacterium]|nr:type III pantothenate kinase [Ruminococcus sp.]MCM1275270.1 type III pantothenate kinase [Lachnospiraceae bacterium]
MILTVDIGNTTIALTVLERGERDYSAVFAEKLPSEKGALERFALPCDISIERAVLSSVVPELTEGVCRAVERIIGKAPAVLSAKDCKTLRFAVPEPERVGFDRIADSAWAAARYPLPAVTVDLGTATTFNVIGEGGVFLGGVIAAGLQISLDALSERAAKLPRLVAAVPERLIGLDTAECMLSGSVIGAAAMIDGITVRVEAELGKPVSLILTGGGAALAEPFLRHSRVYEPLLLAKGLAYIGGGALD